MPRADGLEFIQALQGLAPGAKISAVSAGGPDRLHAAKRAGASAVISKPIGPDELGRALEELGIGQA